MATQPDNACQTRTLPPLILYPFAKAEDTQKLIEGSRLHAAFLDGRQEDEAAAAKLAAVRYHEIRMLYFVGKDIFRWMEQCVDFVNRDPELAGRQMPPQSFADFLVACPPEAVKAKLRSWGVTDSQVLFARAIGLHAMFSGPPEVDGLAQEFLRHYHIYADGLFACYCQTQPFSPVSVPEFEFEIYASGEYSRLLEEKWN